MNLRPLSSIVPGYRLDRYEFLCPIAEGGMASVWVARLQGKHGFEKLVAIKTILPQHSNDDLFRRMFLDEARISSGIEHANVAQILDLGDDRGMLYLVMEWVEGDSLSKLLGTVRRHGKSVPYGVSMRVLADACGGLHAAHELRGKDGSVLGVVHRDVSPQNILVTTKGVAKVIDFGIAKAQGRLAGDTSAGSFKGKVQYMAPEQALGKAIDRRADIWSVGAVLYNLVAGRPPFDGANQLATLHLLTSGGPPPPLPDEVPAALQQVIGRALSFAPDKRYETAADLQRALEEAMAGTGALTSTSDVAAYVLEHLADRSRARREGVELALSAAAERTRVAGLLRPSFNDLGSSDSDARLDGSDAVVSLSSLEVAGVHGPVNDAVEGDVPRLSETPSATGATGTATSTIGPVPVSGSRRSRWPIAAAGALLALAVGVGASVTLRAPAPGVAASSTTPSSPDRAPAPADPRLDVAPAVASVEPESSFELPAGGEEAPSPAASAEKSGVVAADVRQAPVGHSSGASRGRPFAPPGPTDAAHAVKKARRVDYGF